jgi:ribulose-5-phosphate 4-epimerase/fuculose-1-phosphate aldolase
VTNQKYLRKVKNMRVNENQCRRNIVEAGKLLYEKKLLVSTDGNLSVRISENEVFITASGGFNTVSDYVTVD